MNTAVSGAFYWAARRLFQSQREQTQPLEIRARLVKLLYGRASNVLMVGLAGIFSGIFAYVRADETIVLAISTIGFLFVLMRCVTIVVFKRRYIIEGRFEPERWLVGYGLLAAGSSSCWGVVSFCCLAFSHDPVLYMTAVVCNVATAGAVAARSAAAPRIANVQLYSGLLPIIVGSLMTDDRGYAFLVVTVPALLFGLSVLVSEINQQIVDLYSSQLELSKLSNTDYLTKIPNRRYFGECLSAAMVDCRKTLEPLSVFMIDVDFFKGYNDFYGHPAGDECLRRIALILQTNMRDAQDTVSRYGGEEFAVILRNTDGLDAKFIAQRTCDAVAEATLAHCNRKDELEIVTISLGATTSYMPGADPEDLLKLADTALYEAKQLGRNRIALINADLKVIEDDVVVDRIGKLMACSDRTIPK